MVKINLNINKKDLWLISGIIMIFASLVYVIAIGENYAIHGHDSDEINLPTCGNGQILKYSGGVWSCQNDVVLTTDTRCDTSGTCNQVCIGTSCRNSWDATTCDWSGKKYTTSARCRPSASCFVSESNLVKVCYSGVWSDDWEAYPCSTMCGV